MKYSARLILSLVMIGCGLEASSAQAQTSAAPGADQPASGPYISLGAGGNFAGSPITEEGETKLETSAGQVGTVAFGWAAGDGLRAEIEGSYRANDVSSFATLRTNGQLVPLTNVGGDIGTEAVMANILFDIPVRSLGLPVQPYIGGGAGYEWSRFNTSGNGFSNIIAPQNVSVVGPSVERLGDTSSFAYQAIAGLSLPLAPRLNATLEYRYLGTAIADVPLSRSIPGIVVNGAVPSDVQSRFFQLQENAVMVGLRYSLGGP
jgi:opacity protein-like surface antigen